MSKKADFIPFHFEKIDEQKMLKNSLDFYVKMDSRRSLRMFSDQLVPLEVMQNIIKTAGTAPSGAHKQPWTFCLVGNPKIKEQIRVEAEKEEYESYHGRMSEEWLKDLEKFDTDWHKPFLETAPWLIVVFKKIYDLEEGEKRTNYYVSESVGIACGILITAIHMAGLVTLTHTPSPMNFLAKILDRPSNERPYLLLPVGYPASDAMVPKLSRKALDEIQILFD